MTSREGFAPSKHGGKVNETPEDKLAVVRRFNNHLNLQRDKPPGVPERGR